MYNWEFYDKRNRMTHNMIMEHFEMHKEDLEDLITSMQKEGPKVLLDIPDEEKTFKKDVTINDLALLDELSGLTGFLDNFLLTHDMPEAAKEKIRARVLRYQGPQDKA
jgi:hypothetical protein